jgi:ElaB/YqjD/DUF883 family membrane-anchored ribosome-binding protein
MNAREEAWQKDIEAARSDLAQLRTDLSAMGKTVKDIVGEPGPEALDRAREAARKAREQAERAAETATHAIGERPFLSIAGTFIIGLLLGVLLGRQR